MLSSKRIAVLYEAARAADEKDMDGWVHVSWKYVI